MTTLLRTPSPHRTAPTSDLISPVGWAREDSRSATTVLVDQEYETLVSNDDSVVVAPLAEALSSYPWVQDLMFSLIDPAEDETLRRAVESGIEPLGTFTWVKDGAHVELPAQSFTVRTAPRERQFVHDITVYGAGCTVDRVCGTAVAPSLTRGGHVCLAETFVGVGAIVRSFSCDSWGRDMQVTTYNRTRISDRASCAAVSVAVCPVRRHLDDSRLEIGADASSLGHCVVLAPAGTRRMMRAVIDLAGPGAQAEQVARMVSDGGDIRHDSALVASAPDVRGFLESDGLKLGADGRLVCVPALDAGTDRAQLAHGGSLDMVDEEKLDYLRSTGIGEDSARDLIVQCFLDLTDDRIPESVRDTVHRLVTAARGAERR